MNSNRNRSALIPVIRDNSHRVFLKEEIFRLQTVHYMKLLSKNEAYKLLPMVIDNEADREQCASFELYMRMDEELYSLYNSMIRIRLAIRTRMPRAPAPDRLRIRIEKAIETESERLSN